MKRPELIIMDEPAAGLDPLMQQEFYALIEEVKAEGRTIFISSHFVPEVERISDRIAILRAGELVTVEDVRVLKDRALHHFEFRFARPVPREVLVGLPGVQDVLIEDSTVKCTIHGLPDAFVKAAVAYEIVGMKSHEASLEDVFLAFYGGSDTDVA